MAPPRKNIILTKKQSRQLTKHKYSKYFPSILDPNFTHKITHHPIFKKYKLTTNTKKLESLYKGFETNTPLPDDTKKTSSNIRLLKSTQKMLRNFMSPYTPYRGILIYHEMGVGKTCTAISIAENLKKVTTNSNTKIYIIRPAELERQIFDINVVKENRPLFQCTGDTYLQNPAHSKLIERCSGGDETSCDTLKTKIDKDIKKIYEFAGSQTWAKRVDREIELRTRNLPENQKAVKVRQIIGKMFDNSVIIVDEAHELRDNNEMDNKIVPPVMNKVLKNANNLRLIFLTATPIYDKPQNIISLINYLLLNDKRELMREADIFDTEGNLKPQGESELIQKTRGYISFLRASNPFEFPIRISAKYNISNDMLNLAKYPKKDINGKPLDDDNKIKHLELINCPIKNQQLEILNYHIKQHHIPDITEEELDSYESKHSLFDTPPSEPQPIDEADESTVTNMKMSVTKRSKSKQNKSSISKSSDMEKIKQVAYLFERQISNFVYQSLEECNKNIKLVTSDAGLRKVATKMSGKFTYQFNTPEYGKRFLLPELNNWGTKIAKVVERAIASNSPVFIYTNFIASGAIPIAFALEMNGFRRYKQHDTPLLENEYKDTEYRGDYILYTGNPAMSAYASEYLDKGRNMINEKSVKVFIGTSVASEGLNLFGYREAHIVDPWHNINLIEQSIGRVIRTGSHLHLPPQERNVTVYLYAATLQDKESFDLKIYKICEDKAIKAGAVEKILKENAFDCVLNKDRNIYDKETYSSLIPLRTSNSKEIKVSLADVEYSRNCFYMKDCKFKCLGDASQINKMEYNDMPIMKFNIDKEIEEYKNLIIQMMQTSYNVKITNLKAYLQKLINGTLDDSLPSNKIQLKSKKASTKSSIDVSGVGKGNDTDTEWEDEEAFNYAIQEVINSDIMVKDKFGRDGRIVLAGEYLRFIPKDNLSPNMAIQKQYSKPVVHVGEVDLRGYITKLEGKQKTLTEEEKLDYEKILLKDVITKSEQIFYDTFKDIRFNVKVKMSEVLDIVFTKLLYSYKLTIIKGYLDKLIHGKPITPNDNKLVDIIKKHIILMKEIFPSAKQDANYIKNIYGFIIQNENKLELYTLTPEGGFEKSLGNLKKVIESRKTALNKLMPNKLYGYLKYEKINSEPVFKITDILAKGEKKSVKGITCNTKPISQIQKNLNSLDDKVLRGPNIHYSKNALCSDVEILFKRNDEISKNGKKWFYTPEEYHIMFDSSN
jgi:superfamily II DNA or RNA helicase